MAGEIKLCLISCSLDVSSSAIQQDLVLCIVAAGLQAEECKFLVSYYAERAITAYSLSLSQKPALE